jgi:hypothetical protein
MIEYDKPRWDEAFYTKEEAEKYIKEFN